MKSRRLYPILAVVGSLFFALTLIGSLYERDESTININEKIVKSKVFNLVSSIKSLATDGSLLRMVSQKTLDNSTALKELFKKELPGSEESSLYVWNNKELVYWDLGTYDMYKEKIPIAEQVDLLVRETKAYIKISTPPGKSSLGFLYVIPLSDIGNGRLSADQEQEMTEAMNIPGLKDFLTIQANAGQAQFVHIIYLFGYLFLLSFVFLMAHRLVKVFRPEIVLLALILLLFLLRVISFYFPLAHPLLHELFQPHFFSLQIPGSMADWLLNIVIGFLFALFFYVHMPQMGQFSRRWQNQLFTVLAYLVFCFCGVLFSFYVWAMVDNRYIHLDINIIEHLTTGSLVMLFATFLLLLSLFIISIRLFILVQVFEWSWVERMGMFLLAVLISALFLMFTNLDMNIWLWVISLLIIMLLFDLFLDSSMLDFTWVSVWLLILSLFSTVLFFHFYTSELTERSKEALRQKITIPDQRLTEVVQELKTIVNTSDYADPSMEMILNDVLFMNRGITNAYQFSVVELSSNAKFKNYEDIRYRYQSEWPGSYLFLVQKENPVLALEVKDVGTEIRFNKRKRKYKDHVLFNSGDWTIYHDRRITNDESLFFPPALDSISSRPLRDSQFVRDNTIYTLVEKGDKAALGRQEYDGLLQPMSFFSFNFILSLLILSLLLLIHKFIPFLPKELHQYFIENLSIRNKIQFSVLAILITAFAMVGIVSANFYKRSYKETLESTVKEYYQKVKRAQFQSDEILKVLEGIPGRFILFDQQGKAIQSNLYNHYSRLPYHVVRKINLSKTLDRFDEIWPGALILPFSLDQSRTVFLAYPELTAVPEGFYRFINLLLNAFVFLLLISSALSFSISNTIISPLTELGRKLKEFSLGKRNEPIPWKQPDELGTLIQSYNEMVEKLEQSAELLAHSEREVAWREMAKQVAHEIKNPLTPMKLSIQHMEMRIQKAGEAEAKEIVHHVSRVLIEQIDNLSRIASEFSSFAKLPRPEYEEILLNDLVASVYELFRTRSNIKFNLYVPIDELIVQADRTHLIRVMNNLMKNAVQSIPSSREGHIVIRLKEHQGHAIVMVEDNGKGIEDELHEKVFFPNFTTKSSGTGLGLAICKNIIETFSGTIYFVKNKPQGTVFIFELPMVNE